MSTDAEMTQLIATISDIHRKMDALLAERDRYYEALELIAAPMRPDGTWNRDRRACQALAERALRPNG